MFPVRRLRELLDHTLQEFEKFTGCSMSTIRTAEADGSLTLKAAEKIAAATGVSALWLREGGTSEPTTSEGQPYDLNAYRAYRRQRVVPGCPDNLQGAVDLLVEEIVRQLKTAVYDDPYNSATLHRTIKFIESLQRHNRPTLRRLQEIDELEERIKKLRGSP